MIPIETNLRLEVILLRAASGGLLGVALVLWLSPDTARIFVDFVYCGTVVAEPLLLWKSL